MLEEPERIQPIPISDIEQMRMAIFDVLRELHLKFTNADLADYFGSGRDARSLLACLQQSKRFREMRDQELVKPNSDYACWEVPVLP